jgi:hypothetical protein
MKAKVVSRSESMSEQSSDQLVRDEALKARDMVETGYMKLARCLYDIYQQSLYAKWEYVSFENYIDVELQIAYRKALYLVDVYNMAVNFNLDTVRLEKIGWTKTREVAKIINSENADEWLTMAENCTVKELMVAVKAEKEGILPKSNVVDELPTTSTVTFKLGMIEHAIIRDALDESLRLINTDDLALAFTNICQEWCEYKGAAPEQSTLEDHMEHLEKMYGKKLAIVGDSSSLDELDLDTLFK